MTILSYTELLEIQNQSLEKQLMTLNLKNNLAHYASMFLQAKISTGSLMDYDTVDSMIMLSKEFIQKIENA